MESVLADEASAPSEGNGVEPVGDLALEAAVDQSSFSPDLVGDLHDPRLVLSPDYIGTDRRTRGAWAWLRRATFGQRRSLLRLEIAVLTSVALLVAAAMVLVSRDTRAPLAASARSHGSPSRVPTAAPVGAAAPVAAAPHAAPTTGAPLTTSTGAAPTTTAAAPATAPPAPVSNATPPDPGAAPTPTQLGVEALALVRYPWQNIPGYSIQFEPISAAPSSDFYGNTTFTWGRAGGTSVLYVYPGESVQKLAGITAFEIGHEVDAAAVEPQGGETRIENILGIHPASWAPNCDCAEQGFLSGWYAAAFSNYWSPGVGNWSALAPEPTGATLAAVEPWLDPTVS